MEQTEKKHYENHRERLRDRFMKAPEAVHDAEILELLLTFVIKRSDVKPQAKEILEKSKQLCNVFESDIQSVKGCGKQTEFFFTLLKEFINRMDYEKIHDKPVNLSLTADVYKFLKSKIGYSSKEIFAILFLDSKNKLKGCKIVRSGFINSVAMHARDVIEEAITNNAVGVIIAHNHPSGDASPSKSDLEVTQKIAEALKHTGVNLVDHMIVAYHEYYSMKAHGDL